MSCEVDKFTKEILNYCKLHPGPESDYHIKCIEDSEARRKEILKKWRHIAWALENYKKEEDMDG